VSKSRDQLSQATGSFFNLYHQQTRPQSVGWPTHPALPQCLENVPDVLNCILEVPQHLIGDLTAPQIPLHDLVADHAASGRYARIHDCQRGTHISHQLAAPWLIKSALQRFGWLQIEEDTSRGDGG
jgi:hypothetical protein